MYEKKSVGIIGGGQLGAMMIAAGIKLGLDMGVLEKDMEAPCSKYSGAFVLGDPMNYDDVVAFGKDKDIITIEKEAVNADALEWLSGQGVKIYPSPKTIKTIQNKFTQKQFLEASNIPVAKGQLVNNKQELAGLITQYPVCLKLCRNGYDGKGVMILKNEDDILNAFDAPSIAEEMVHINKEISVIVARNASGTCKHYEPVEMVYNEKDNILDYQLCPADITTEQYNEMCNLALRIADSIGLIGVMAVEMFLDNNNHILVNELAPRPHNSGHHTIETAGTSQFEQHLRAILDLPLGDTQTTNKSVMLNMIGNDKLKAAGLMHTLMGMNDVHVHWYGKAQFKTGRKLGHITVEDANLDAALEKALEIRKMIQ